MEEEEINLKSYMLMSDKIKIKKTNMTGKEITEVYVKETNE